MRLIKIIAVGRIKEKYLTDAIHEYVKRLTRFCKFEIVEVEDEKMPREASPAQILAGIKVEGDRVKTRISDRAFVIVMDVKGNEMNSETLAERLSDAVDSFPEIVFIIGGSAGLHPDLIRLADIRLSMSKLTFPHQLARLILTEQIFRAFKIINHEIYHK